jgi:hypothetical protein
MIDNTAVGIINKRESNLVFEMRELSVKTYKNEIRVIMKFKIESDYCYYNGTKTLFAIPV